MWKDHKEVHSDAFIVFFVYFRKLGIGNRNQNNKYANYVKQFPNESFYTMYNFHNSTGFNNLYIFPNKINNSMQIP